MKRGLKMGVAGHLDDEDGSFEIGHAFAHDKTHAYDSSGKHPLPYLGIHHQFTHHELNQNPADYEFPEEESGPEGSAPNIRDAMAHASRNGILEGRYGSHAAS